jgi:3-methyladenine DNA glycosylase AlkD
MSRPASKSSRKPAPKAVPKSAGAGSTAKQVLAQLEALGDAKVRERNARLGAGARQFGVKMGDIRKVAKSLGADHDLGLALWKSGNLDARLLAILLIKPQALSAKELDSMVRAATFPGLADWLNAYVVKQHPDKETLRKGWMTDADPLAARAGWNLTAERVARDADGLELTALLDRIEAELGSADPAAQWTMNGCLATIGIHHVQHRKRALAIGEKLGLYRDFPVSKGCTSPFAPIWIAEMVRRQG